MMRNIACEVICIDCGHKQIAKGITEGGLKWWFTSARFCDKCDGVVTPVSGDPKEIESV